VPSQRIASRCRAFILERDASVSPKAVQIINLRPNLKAEAAGSGRFMSAAISAVLLPEDKFSLAKQFWQHSGEGISSRRAEYCQVLFDRCLLSRENEAEIADTASKGPKRYRTSVAKASKSSEANGLSDRTNGIEEDHGSYIEERFGRNLELSFSSGAKLAIRRRIAGCVSVPEDLAEKPLDEAQSTACLGGRVSEQDVYLYPTGMSAIYNTHRILLAAHGDRKTVCYG
jgi:cystathionine gamma-synthase